MGRKCYSSKSKSLFIIVISIAITFSSVLSRTIIFWSLFLITDQQQRTFSSAESNEKSTTSFVRAREHHRIFQHSAAPCGAEMTIVGLVDVIATVNVRVRFFRAGLAYFQILAISS